MERKRKSGEENKQRRVEDRFERKGDREGDTHRSRERRGKWKVKVRGRYEKKKGWSFFPPSSLLTFLFLYEQTFVSEQSTSCPSRKGRISPVMREYGRWLSKRINTFNLPLSDFLSLPHKAQLLTGCGIKNEIALSIIM